jgi:hypothetical protein
MSRKLDYDPLGHRPAHTTDLVSPSRRAALRAGSAAAAAMAFSASALGQATGDGETEFRRISPQFIAALGEPDATSGDNAERWGLWRRDPGPRCVRLSAYERLMTANGVAPAGWRFDSADWWLEEHGLIMEAPEFPLAAGRYFVTGDRAARAVLTVLAAGPDGARRGELDGGATLHDVTHLACRSARYTPSGGACSPSKAKQSEFPVQPGAPMPPVAGCDHQDYAVLIVIGLPVEA